jgi:hypothetical protein
LVRIGIEFEKNLHDFPGLPDPELVRWKFRSIDQHPFIGKAFQCNPEFKCSVLQTFIVARIELSMGAFESLTSMVSVVDSCHHSLRSVGIQLSWRRHGHTVTSTPSDSRNPSAFAGSLAHTCAWIVAPEVTMGTASRSGNVVTELASALRTELHM